MSTGIGAKRVEDGRVVAIHCVAQRFHRADAAFKADFQPFGLTFAQGFGAGGQGGQIQWRDLVVNLAGAPIADRPWTAARRNLLWASRVTLTEQLLTWLGTREQRPQVLHQAGEKQIEGLRAAYARARVEGDLRPFIEDMATAYAEADLVICRAGALTVAELAVVGAASLLVPFPHAVDDHQTGNARFLAERGGAYLLPQTELNAERLAGILASIDRPRLLQMAEHARALARPLAAAEVARVCEQLAGGDKT